MSVSPLRLTTLLFAVLVASCGFRLQGHTPLPDTLSDAYVFAADQQSDFVQGLRRALLVSGAQLAPESEKASGTVHISKDEVTQKVLSVSANNIPREYEITYTVEFSVSVADKEVLSPQKVFVTRNYSFDERTLLAKENEEAILREGMARDLVGIVMRRLSSL
jgi:LPS-assembly lipoprotein